MNINPNIKIINILIIFLSLCFSANAFDGHIITVINKPKHFNNPIYEHEGQIIRYEFKNYKIISTKIIYNGLDATRVSLSADGTKVLYFTDTKMVLIDAKTGKEISSINMDTKIIGNMLNERHWPITQNSKWLIFIPTSHGKKTLNNTGSIMRLNIYNGKVESFLDLNTDLQGFYASAFIDKNFGKITIMQDNGNSSIIDLSDNITTEKLDENPVRVTCGYDLSFNREFGLENGGTHTKGSFRNNITKKNIPIAINMYDKNNQSKKTEWMGFIFSKNDNHTFLVSQEKRINKDKKSNIVNAVFYDIKNQKQIIINRDKKNIKEIPIGSYSYKHKEINDQYSLGRFAGKVPFKYKLNNKFSSYEVNYGDGKIVKYKENAPINHTYQKVGDYTLVLKDNKENIYKALIRVKNNAKLKYIKSTIFNDNTFVVKFNQSINNYQILNASINNTNENNFIETKILKNYLKFTTSKPLKKNFILKLDLKNEQDKSLNFQINIKKGDFLYKDLLYNWDTDGTHESSLGYYYINTNDMKFLRILKAKEISNVYAFGGALKLNSHFAYHLPNDLTKRILVELKRSKSFSVDMVFETTTKTSEFNKLLFKLSTLFELSIKDKKILLYEMSKREFIPTNCNIESKLNTLTLLYKNEKLDIYLNDENCFNKKIVFSQINQNIIKTYLHGWYYKLHLGNMPNVEHEKRFNNTKVYSFRIYSKKHNLKKIISSRYDNNLFNSKIIKAKLIEKSYAPTHNEVLPYTRVLMLNKYSITEDAKDLLKGKKSKDNNFYSSLPFFKNMFNKNYNKIIGVAEWSLSEKEKTENSRKKIGDIYSLDLLPFNKINELQNEYVSDTINDSYDLEVYFANN